MLNEKLNGISLGLPSRIDIPPAVSVACDSAVIEAHPVDPGLFQGLHPRPACWIACGEAWPHTDPNWDGQLFPTLVVQGDHSFETLNDDGRPVSIPAFPGTLMLVDPMRLHWLRPNNSETNPGFIALQWEVDAADAPACMEAIHRYFTPGSAPSVLDGE